MEMEKNFWERKSSSRNRNDPVIWEKPVYAQKHWALRCVDPQSLTQQGSDPHCMLWFYSFRLHVAWLAAKSPPSPFSTGFFCIFILGGSFRFLVSWHTSPGSVGPAAHSLCKATSLVQSVIEQRYHFMEHFWSKSKQEKCRGPTVSLRALQACAWYKNTPVEDSMQKRSLWFAKNY